MPRLEYQNPNPGGGLEGGQLKTYRKSNVSVMLLWEAAFTPHSHHSCSSCIHLHREVVPETGGALTIPYGQTPCGPNPTTEIPESTNNGANSQTTLQTNLHLLFHKQLFQIQIRIPKPTPEHEVLSLRIILGRLT